MDVAESAGEEVQGSNREHGTKSDIEDSGEAMELDSNEEQEKLDEDLNAPSATPGTDTDYDAEEDQREGKEPSKNEQEEEGKGQGVSGP